MSQTEDIFIAVPESNLKLVLDDILQNHCDILVRASDRSSRIGVLHGYTISSLTLDFGEPLYFLKNDKVTIHFRSMGEKYFVRANVHGQLKEEVISFRLATEIYKVQRRANFRVAVPDNEEYDLELYDPDDGEFVGRYKLKDISAGGCRVYFNDPFPERMRSKRFFSGRLKVWGHNPIQIGCEVRHIQKSKANTDPDDKEAGIQFQIDDPKAEHRLLSLVFELQRKMVRTE